MLPRIVGGWMRVRLQKSHNLLRIDLLTEGTLESVLGELTVEHVGELDFGLNEQL